MNKVVRLNKDHEDGKEKLKYSRFLTHFPEFNLGSLLVTFICVIIMIIATFIIIPVGLYDSRLINDTYSYFNDINNIILTLHTHLYTPQIPVAVFAGALLGPKLGSFAMIIYVILGLLGFPVFAYGGGIRYIFKPMFGFILGYILSSYVVGKINQRNLSSLTIILGSIAGVISAHFIGDVYLVYNLYSSGSTWTNIQSWLWSMSFSNIGYDIIFSIILSSLARPIRGLLWVTMG